MKFSNNQIKKTNTLKVEIPNQSQEFPFVNLIRFVSMLGIVWAHITFLPINIPLSIFLKHISNLGIYMVFMQFFKFGVICFFIISGYLFASKDLNTTPFKYLEKRLDSTLKPYLLVAFLVILMPFIGTFRNQGQLPTNILEIFKIAFVDTSLWYLPNYLICLTTLLLLHKYLENFWLGLILLLISISYSFLSVYTIGYQASHTTATFAFVFYLWLGYFIRKKNIIDVICSYQMSTILITTLMFYIMACVESYLLFEKNHIFYFSILRYSNQLYSVSMFFLLVKLSQKGFRLKFVNPRKETYGIYLYHLLFALVFLPKIVIWSFRFFNLSEYIYNTWVFMAFFILLFLICYGTTLIFVRMMLKLRWGYLN